MTLTVNVPADVETALQRQVARTGQGVNDFVVQAIQEKIAKARTFDDICAPFAHAVQASGMSDEEFDRFFEGARQEVWQEKQGHTG